MLDIELQSEKIAVFRDYIGAVEVKFLLDTGSNVCVFNKCFANITDVFPDATKLDIVSNITTPYGTQQQEVWHIPRFYLRNLRIDNLVMVAHNFGSFPAGIILSGHLFKRNPFKIDYANYKLEIDDRFIVINCDWVEDKKKKQLDHFYVLAATTEEGVL